jgi:hypothetical protein
MIRYHILDTIDEYTFRCENDNLLSVYKADKDWEQLYVQWWTIVSFVLHCVFVIDDNFAQPCNNNRLLEAETKIEDENGKFTEQ